MSEMMFKLIDICSEYIEEKDLHYICKDNFAVYYTSPTGRKSDYAWKRLTLTEMTRVIKAIHLNPRQVVAMREHLLVTAFQELGRVYEYSVKVKHKVADRIFNYLEHCEHSLGDEIMSHLATEFVSRGHKALLLVEVMDVFMAIQGKLEAGISWPQARELLCKHFGTLGYGIRAGAHRPLVKGRKTPAIMMSGTVPSQIRSIDPVEAEVLIKTIYGEVK